MKPEKLGGWLQGLYATSSTAREIVGTMREDLWGNRYAYAKAGTTGLAASKMTISTADDVDWVSEACTAQAIGDKVLTQTITCYDAAIAKDYFAGGQFILTDGTAEGLRYTIVSSSAVTSTGTEIKLTLDDALVEALTSATEFTLVKSPYYGTVIQATETNRPCGVPLVDVTAAYYYWSQIGGEALCLGGGEAGAVGSMVSAAGEDGAMEEINLSGAAQALTLPIYGMATGTTVVNGEYTPVKLTIG